jgi:NADH:ubiquinone oxidoreductase subunit 4 (subunit M)
LNAREIGTLVPLAALCLVLGVYPKPLIQALNGPVDAVVAKVQTARETVAEVQPSTGAQGALVSENTK